MKKKLFYLPFIFILITALFSCSNLFNSAFSDSNDSEKAVDGGYQISGTVSPYDFAETSPARTAFPTAPDSTTKLYYRVTATLGGKTVIDDVEGINGAQFNLKIPSAGEWSITATCFGTDSNRTTVVYKTEKPQVISVTNASPSKFANLTLKPLMTTGKSGTLNLEIDGTGLDEDSFHPSEIQVECISRNLPDMNDRISASFDNGTKKYTLKTNDGQSLPSGSYTLNLNFFSSNKVCFYSVTETVNIYDGLETNRWVKNGDEEYITSDGKFVLTDAIVNKFQQESIYVDSEALSDSASGTWIDPYKTLDAAIDRLKASPSITTIFVSGKLETSKALDFSNDGNVTHDLTIKKNPRASTKPVVTTTTKESFIYGGPRKIVLENIDFKGCGNEVGATQTGTNSDPSTKAGAFLYFPSSNGSAELTNCTISDYYSHKGGAICAAANSTFTLTNVDITRCKAQKGGAIFVNGNVTYVSGNITDCWADNNGGAIYHESGNLTIEEGVCIGKRNATAIADITNLGEHKYSNYAYNYGGGIYSEGGTLSLKGLISYNAVTNSGGGLYLGKIGFSLTYNPTDELEVSYNCAGTTGGGILYTERKSSSTYDIRGKIHHNQAKTGGGLCISPQTNGNTFNIFSPVYNNKAYAETSDDDSFGSGGGISILSSNRSTFNINTDITQNTASNLGGGIFVDGTADTEVHISGKLSGNAISGSNPILSHGIDVHTGKLCLNSDSEISSGQDMYVYNSTSRIKIQDAPSKLGNIKLYLNTNPDDNGFKSGDEIFTGNTEEILRAGLSKITPSDPDSFSFNQNGTSAFLSRNVYIAGSDSTKLTHGVNQALSANPDRGKKNAPFASLSYASRQFSDEDFITYYIEGTTVEGSTTAADNPCIFMIDTDSPKTITVRGYEGGKRATLTGMRNNNEFGENYSTFFYNVAGNLTISDIDIDGTQSTYLAAVITGDPTLLNTPVTNIYNVNIKNFTFVASGTDPETGVILCDSPNAVINIKNGSIKDCNRTGGVILAKQGDVHISLHEISGCTNVKNEEDAIVTSGDEDTKRGYLHLENTKISGTDSTKSLIKIIGSPVSVKGNTIVENGYLYLSNNGVITLKDTITSDICAHIRSSNPNAYATVLRVDTEGHSLDEQKEILTNSYTKFIYDGTYELQPVFAASYYANLFGVSYVDGSNGKTRGDGGTGAKDNPFKTVSEAVDELRTQLNSGSNKNAIVYVAGTTEESSVINTEDVSVSLSTLTIKQWPGKTKAVIKRGATHTDSIIKVSSNSALTLENIEINGNNVVLTDKNGAGIYIDEEGSATLTNVKIYGCKVKQETTPAAGENLGQGGAIFVKTTTSTSGSSSLVLKGNTVIGSDITGTLSEENCSNMAHDGGAIYYYNINSTSLKIDESVIIKGNYASANGGAIYLNYRYAYLNGTITNNKAGNAGGAIYNYRGFVKGTGTISGNTSSMGSIYSVVSSNTNEYIYLNSKTNIGPDDEIVLGYDGNNSSNFGRIFFDEELSSQTNPIKVSCENPVATARYVSGKTINLVESEILNLSYNGIFRFITSGDNRGKIEVAPVYVAGEGSGMTGNNSNPGTEAEPLATVASAVNKIKDFGGTIYVAGTTTETNPINFANSATTKTFEIMTWPSKQKAVIKRAVSQMHCMINIPSENVITFNNLDIDGASIAATENRGPAGISTSGSLTLNNVNIKNIIRSTLNTPTAGAIDTSGSFTMKGGSITNCIIGTTDSPDGPGGAIYKSGTDKPCVLENVTFSGNKARNGSGIYVASGPITLKGSTNFSTSTGDINDIYLDGTSKIVIDGDLSAETVAVISLPMGEYNFTSRKETTILSSSDADGVKKNYQKFSINSQNYSITEDGKFGRAIPLTSSSLLGLKSTLELQFPENSILIVKLPAELDLSETIEVPENKTLYLMPSGNSSTIKNTSDSSRMFTLESGSNLIVTDVTLDGNDVPVEGAGSIIYAGGTVRLNGDTKITNGLCVPTEPLTGGAIYSTPAGSIYITDNVIISNNKTNDESHMGADINLSGGGICANGPLYISGNAKITGNSIVDNHQWNKIYGAGISSKDYLTITGNVEISENYLELRNTGMYALGVGISASGSLSINGTDVKINNNHVNVYGELTNTYSGGMGIYAPTSTEVSLEGNITVTGNSTQTDWQYDSGYGIYAADLPQPADIHFEEGSEGLRVYGNSKNGEAPQDKQYFTNRN